VKRKARKEKDEESQSIFDSISNRKSVYPDLPPELLPNMTQDVFADENEDADDEDSDKDEDEDEDEIDEDAESLQNEMELDEVYHKLKPTHITEKNKQYTEAEKRSDMWFSKPIFQGLLDEEDEDETITGRNANDNRKELKREENRKRMLETRSKKKLKKRKVEKVEEKDNEPFEEVPIKRIPEQDSDIEKPPANDIVVSDSDYDTDDKKDVLALATVAVRQGKLSEIVDDAYNRYAWNDYHDIPKWFGDEYKLHSQPQLPITKEISDEIRQRFKEINARPMQKVAEAKARKKKRVDRKLQSLRSKANSIVETPELSEASKMKQIQKLYAKANLQPKKKVTYIVRKKFQTRGGTPTKRPTGSGKTKVVDPRMKKDKRSAPKKIGKSNKIKKPRSSLGRRTGKI